MDEAERILALPDEELDKELAEAGFDPEKVRARGRELFEKLMRQASAPKTEDSKAEQADNGAAGASSKKAPGQR